jgi:hypothetical protein
LAGEMEPTIIDRLYKDNQELLAYLVEKGEISFQSNVEDNVRKTLLLSAASYFESTIMDILISFFQELTNNSELTIKFIQNKALQREYSKLFKWDGNNANMFFAFFGEGFKDFMKAEVKKDKQLEEAIRAFLKLGNSRNELVHENFAIFPLQNTADEIYELYKQAALFVKILPEKLREYADKTQAGKDQAT